MFRLNVICPLLLIFVSAGLCHAQVASKDAIESKKTSDQEGSPAEKAAGKVLAELGQKITDNDFRAVSKLMTEAGFAEYFAGEVLGALAMTQHPMGGVENSALVKFVEKYELDDIDFPEMTAGPEAFVKLKKQINDRYSAEQRFAILKEIADAEAPPADDEEMGMMIEIDPYSGAVVGSTNETKTAITLKVKPQLPDFGDLPGGMEPGMLTDIPPFFVRFKLVDKRWLWDGIDMEKMMEMMPDGPMGVATIEDPEFSGITYAGNSVDLKSLRGKVVMVDFWGTWCAPCVAALPRWKAVHELLKPHGFEILGVAMDEKDAVKELDTELELPWKNILDPDGQISSKYGIQAFPTTLLIDKDGNHIASNLEGAEFVNKISELLELDDETIVKLKKAMKQRAPKSKKSPTDSSKQ